MKKIDKIIFSTSGISILFILLLLCFISPMKSVNSEDITTKSVNWMSNLKDSTLICDINIPGTHDSGTKLTAGLVTGMVASTQSDSIAEQLGKGIRYLDIRVDSDMDVNHAGIVCYISIFKKLKLKNVLDDVSDFLKQHPTETVIVQIKKEGKGSREETFTAEVDKVLTNYKSLYKKSKNVGELTLGDARGKFIIFSRNKHPKFSYPLYGWPDDCDFAEITLDNSKAFLQDKYSIKNANDKFQSVKSFYNKIWENKNDLRKSYIINFISCIGYYMPKQVASSVNKKFQNFVKENKDKKFGIVLMDNPSLENIETLYSTNF